MFDPANRFSTIVLTCGAAVLLLALVIGQRMGDRVLGQATEHTLPSIAAVQTPEPDATPGPFGPDWKRSEALSAAPDPRFPDPRVPPRPLPTVPPATAAPIVPATATPNPNVPIWRQQPLPTATPLPILTPEGATPVASASPLAENPEPAGSP
ncbi:MAG TPA: hypothetical protein VNG31_07155 [Candidatus Baltobacteraceae bacterium]|nr:hypothetical protein [Candidatus Baltobacteraceae bacterium]